MKDHALETSVNRDESKGQSGYNWYKAVLRCSNPRIGFLPSIIYFFRRGYKHIHCSAFSAFYIWPFGRIWNGYWIYTISLYSFKSLLSLLPKARNKTLENSIQLKFENENIGKSYMRNDTFCNSRIYFFRVCSIWLGSPFLHKAKAVLMKQLRRKVSLLLSTRR